MSGMRVPFSRSLLFLAMSGLLRQTASDLEGRSDADHLHVGESLELQEGFQRLPGHAGKGAEAGDNFPGNCLCRSALYAGGNEDCQKFAVRERMGPQLSEFSPWMSPSWHAVLPPIPGYSLLCGKTTPFIPQLNLLGQQQPHLWKG